MKNLEKKELRLIITSLIRLEVQRRKEEEGYKEKKEKEIINLIFKLREGLR